MHATSEGVGMGTTRTGPGRGKPAKAFIVISMGVCTLIKKKKERKNHVFYRQSDFILGRAENCNSR